MGLDQSTLCGIRWACTVVDLNIPECCLQLDGSWFGHGELKSSLRPPGPRRRRIQALTDPSGRQPQLSAGLFAANVAARAQDPAVALDAGLVPPHCPPQAARRGQGYLFPRALARAYAGPGAQRGITREHGLFSRGKPTPAPIASRRCRAMR